MPFGQAVGQGFVFPEVLIANILEIIGPNGHVQIENQFGAIVFYANHQGLFTYLDEGSATQGPLILAVNFSSASILDPIDASTVVPGLTGIDPVFGDSMNVIGSNINLGAVGITSDGTVGVRVASGGEGPFTLVNAPEESVAGHAQLQLFGATSTVPAGFLVAQSVTGSATATRQTSAPLEIQEADGNIYTAGDSTKQVTTGIVINQTTFSQAVVPSWNVAADGTYDFEAQLWYTTGAAAGAPEFQVAGTATASVSAFDFEVRLTGQTAATSLVGSLTAYGGTMTGPAMTAANVTLIMYVRGSATFTSGGTLRFQAATTVAADTYTILAGSKATLSRTG